MTVLKRFILIDDNDDLGVSYEPYATSSVPGVIKTDDATLTSNEDNQYSVAGVKTQNDRYMFDWIGTTLEYVEAKKNGTIQSNWMCYITDDGGGGVGVWANASLQNLTALGNARLQYIPFTINTGSIDSNGENNTLTYFNFTITCTPCTITTIDGVTYVDEETRTLEIASNLTAGSYKVLKSISGSLAITSEFDISKTAPNRQSGWWLDISVVPGNMKEYLEGQWAVNNNWVVIGELTIAADHTISEIINYEFNRINYIIPIQKGNAGKFLRTDGRNLSWEHAPFRNIGEVVWSPIPLIDAGLHLADGTLIPPGGIYNDFTTYMHNRWVNESLKLANVDYVGSLKYEEDSIITGKLGLSGFSSSNFVSLPVTFNPGNKTWMIEYIIHTSSDVTTGQWIASSLDQSYSGVELYLSDGKISLGLSSNGNTHDIGTVVGSVTISPNSIYYIQVLFNGYQYSLLISPGDNQHYTIAATVNSSTPIISGKIALGIDYNDQGTYSSPFLGSIVLSLCNIYMGGRWWSGVLPKWATDEPQWEEEVAKYGVCTKFVIDPGTATVRLPKISGITESTNDYYELDNIIEAGLPNIEGKFVIQNYRNNTQVVQDGTGAFYQIGNNNIKQVWGTDYLTGLTDIEAYETGFDASRSNAMFGKYSTVQPQTGKLYCYIVISNSTKTAIENNIDNIATDLNNKTDRDLLNLSNTGKIAGSGFSMPSSTKYLDVTLQSSGSTYTSPANGWWYFRKLAYAGEWTNINGPCIAFDCSAQYDGDWLSSFIPVNKGDMIQVLYTASGMLSYFRFYYAVGSESEAS